MQDHTIKAKKKTLIDFMQSPVMIRYVTYQSFLKFVKIIALAQEPVLF